jgi:hypothetical protein
LRRNQNKVTHYQTKKEKEKAAQHSTYQINTRTRKTNEPKKQHNQTTTYQIPDKMK